MPISDHEASFIENHYFTKSITDSEYNHVLFPILPKLSVEFLNVKEVDYDLIEKIKTKLE